MGLGTVKEGNNTYLSIAGGFIWNKGKDISKEDPNYATQEYTKADKSTGIRAGLQYGDLTGKITNVFFRTHKEYGESVNVNFASGDENYIVSISTNNRYSQDMMKALLKLDLSKDVFIKPYDFIGSDKRRAQGISFRQDGVKVDLKTDVPAEFTKDKDWFKTANSKNIKRFFEDLSDWFVAEIEEKICPQFVGEKKSEAGTAKVTASEPESTETDEEPVAEKKSNSEPKKLTPLAMKKVLTAYIAENYPEKELPKLTPAEIKVWYDLAQGLEDLPFESDLPNAAVSDEDLDAQLGALIG